jgi:MYXO-CTERM domain-containing protein
VPPLPAGAVCEKNSDCEGELQCLSFGDPARICGVRVITPTPIQPPLPTPASTATATPSPIPTRGFRDDDGCTVAGGGAPGWGFWLGLGGIVLARVRRRPTADSA